MAATGAEGADTTAGAEGAVMKVGRGSAEGGGDPKYFATKLSWIPKSRWTWVKSWHTAGQFNALKAIARLLYP